jgi:hypothetical protein
MDRQRVHAAGGSIIPLRRKERGAAIFRKR